MFDQMGQSAAGGMQARRGWRGRFRTRNRGPQIFVTGVDNEWLSECQTGATIEIASSGQLFRDECRRSKCGPCARSSPTRSNRAAGVMRMTRPPSTPRTGDSVRRRRGRSFFGRVMNDVCPSNRFPRGRVRCPSFRCRRSGGRRRNRAAPRFFYPTDSNDANFGMRRRSSTRGTGLPSDFDRVLGNPRSNRVAMTTRSVFCGGEEIVGNGLETGPVSSAKSRVSLRRASPDQTTFPQSASRC